MKEIEELLDEIMNFAYEHSCDDIVTLNKDIILAKFSEREKENENLRCCGNCKFIDGIYCNQDDRGQVFIHNYQYCSNWQSDNLTRKERET
jgi:hypothetical protein